MPLKLANSGRSASLAAHVSGSLPLKFDVAEQQLAERAPAPLPGYQAMTTAGTFASHGMSMTLPPSSTTTIGLPIAATAGDQRVLHAVALGIQAQVDVLYRATPGARLRAIAGARVLLALVLRRQAGDHDDEVGAGRARRRVATGSR